MNRLPGQIADIEVAGSVALVEVAVGRYRFTATLIGADSASWQPATSVTLLFKETEVSLAKNLSGLISMRNRLPSTVIALEQGQLLTKVTLDMNGHILTSIITTKSSRMLELAVGDAVEGLVKTNEMSLVQEFTA